jgi:hypothetical protein
MPELWQGNKGVLETEWKKINIHRGKEWQECILLFLLLWIKAFLLWPYYSYQW